MARSAEHAPAAPALLPQPWIVRRVARETGDVVSLEMEPGPQALASHPRPGQFHMLYAFGVGEVPISVAGTGATGRVTHTVRDVGAVTHALCSLAPGDVVGVRGPFGSHWPVDEQAGRDVVIAAGGIGIAPLRPVVEHVAQHRDRYDDVVVLYGARGPGDLLYARDRERWRAARIQVEITVDHADHGWDGHVGVVTTLIRHGKFDPDQAAVFLCGPEVMMYFTARELIQRAVDPRRVYLSLERNMKCAVGHCGHCQLGPEFLCLDGPVFPWARVHGLMTVREL